MQKAWVDVGHHPLTRAVLKRIGLPSAPPLLRSYRAWSDELLRGKRVLVSKGGSYSQMLIPYLDALKAHVDPVTITAAAPDAEGAKPHPMHIYQGTVFDATGMTSIHDLKALYLFFQPHLHKLGFNHRMVVLIPTPPASASPEAWATSRAIEGFVRSLSRELGPKAINLNGVRLAASRSGSDALHPLVAFLLSDACAFVTGQVFELAGEAIGPIPESLAGSLAGKRALVTGAAQGIGYAICRRLAEEGAHVIGLDRPSNAEPLQELVRSIEGEAILAELGGSDSVTTVLNQLQRSPATFDVVIHNAGVTRDRSLFAMSERQWDQVMDVNLGVVVELTQNMLHRGLFHPGAHIICMSSIVAIAGNYGQTNYGASKAGLLGFVAGLANHLSSLGMTANAVAPGFIETPMTANLPFLAKQVARRLSSFGQGGLPDDVAEVVAFLASPCSQGLNGAVIRVCGGSHIGA